MAATHLLRLAGLPLRFVGGPWHRLASDARCFSGRLSASLRLEGGKDFTTGSSEKLVSGRCGSAVDSDFGATAQGPSSAMLSAADASLELITPCTPSPASERVLLLFPVLPTGRREACPCPAPVIVRLCPFLCVRSVTPAEPATSPSWLAFECLAGIDLRVLRCPHSSTLRASRGAVLPIERIGN